MLEDQMTQEAEVEETGAMGVCIEIHCKPDGTFEVVTEPLAGDEEMGETGEPAQSFGEALKMVVAKYQEWSDGGEDEQMSSGFNSVRPSAAQ